jgi:hypothetical protein
MMLYRKNDAPLDFDFAKVTEQSKDNPVFYVQYASARCHSVFRQARELFPEASFARDELSASAHLLGDEGEIAWSRSSRNIRAWLPRRRSARAAQACFLSLRPCQHFPRTLESRH